MNDQIGDDPGQMESSSEVGWSESEVDERKRIRRVFSTPKTTLGI